MCGIAGIMVDAPNETDVDLMLAMLSHRGPDELGTYRDDSLCMGTARLSIVDIAHGQQPIRHEESGVVIAYNGEVFNYRELREDLLDDDEPLRTQSDTEVVLRLYLKYGESFATHLNGQYAVAIWDPRRDYLLLTRDRFGICPLFFHEGSAGLCFASEVKALITLPWVPRRINPRCIDQVFSFWVPLAGSTAFDDIREARPGIPSFTAARREPACSPIGPGNFPACRKPPCLDSTQPRSSCGKLWARRCRFV